MSITTMEVGEESCSEHGLGVDEVGLPAGHFNPFASADVNASCR